MTRMLNGAVSSFKNASRSRRPIAPLTLENAPILNPTPASSATLSSSTYSLSSSVGTDILTTNKKITQLIRTGKFCEAKVLFDKTEQRNTVTWNTMISGFVKRREMAKARKLFEEMSERDIVSWNLMISGYLSCGGIRFLEEARLVFDKMPERDFVSYNTMVSGYAKNGKIDEALNLFNCMPETNVISWNAMISGFLQNGDVARAMEFFERMPERDSASLSALVSGLIRNGKLDEAAGFLIECGSLKDDLVHAYNTLIAGYGQRGKVDEARRLFDQIPIGHGDQSKGRFKRNVVSWNSMIMCYVKAGDVVTAREMFDQMMERDTFSWNTIISGYIHASDMEEALSLFGKMPSPDTLSWNMMVSGYAQVGKLEAACNFFKRMPQKNIVSWNSLIAGYEKNEDFQGAADVFIQMQDAGQKPDRHTLSSLLSVSTGLVNMQLGTQMHQIVTKTVIPDVPINNSLITMYSRCGAITQARMIFDEMRIKIDVITWNAVIGGYASHGHAEEALSLFKLMKSNRIQPTYISFIAILNACANAGLVDESRRQFQSMVNEYGIEPRIEHYASLVDVISRYGQLQEAMDVIKSMPFEPDNAVWGSVLSACRVHNNFELARMAAEALMKLEPESSAPYILLYNMYAGAGRWEDAAEVRAMMERNNIKKERASSWLGSSQPSD